MKDKVIPLPAEAYDIKKYQYMGTIDRSDEWWIKLGIVPEWGRLNKYQNIIHNRIVTLVSALEVINKCIRSNVHKEYIKELIISLNKLIPFIADLKP